MSDINDLAWRVFRESFKDGDEVTVEDSAGDYYWGVLSSDESGIVLTRPNGKSKPLRWKQVVFISHSAFPFEEINGMSREEAESRANQTSTELIRDVFDSITKKNKDHRKEYRRRVGGGCPFVYGPFEPIALLNKGNNGPAFWGEDDEELLILEAANGSRAHSFDMNHLFFFND